MIIIKISTFTLWRITPATANIFRLNQTKLLCKSFSHSQYQCLHARTLLFVFFSDVDEKFSRIKTKALHDDYEVWIHAVMA